MSLRDIVLDIIGKLQVSGLKKSETEMVATKDLLTNPYNRQLDRAKVDRIKEAIVSSDKIIPVVYAEIDHDGSKSKMLTDGHHRHQALKELGYKEVPAVMQDDRGIDTKSPEVSVEKIKLYRRFNIGDNVIFYNSKFNQWDRGVVTKKRAQNSYVVKDPDGWKSIVDSDQMRVNR